MLTTIDSATIQPLPSVKYFDVCVTEENPWRKIFHTGTAGSATEFFCAERLAHGATYQFIRLARAEQGIAAHPQNDIETLISLMKPSMSQLATAFRVSRQRIYDWRNGKGMSAANLDQMSALLTAARMLNDRSAVPLSQIASRKLSNGKSFWDAISSGMRPADAAANVLEIIDRDQSERNALKRSLAGRTIARTKEPPLFSAYLSE